MQKGIWDYDLESNSLRDSRLIKWLFERQINFANWQKIDFDLLRKHLPSLEIDQNLKEVLQNFLKTHGKNKSSFRRPDQIP